MKRAWMLWAVTAVSTVHLDLLPGIRARLDATQWRFEHHMEVNLAESWRFTHDDHRKIEVSLETAPLLGSAKNLTEVCRDLERVARMRRTTEIRRELLPHGSGICRVMRRYGYLTTEQVAFVRKGTIFFLTWSTLFPHYPRQRVLVTHLAQSLSQD